MKIFNSPGINEESKLNKIKTIIETFNNTELCEMGKTVLNEINLVLNEDGEFKKYPKKEKPIKEYPLCICGHFSHNHNDLPSEEDFEYSKKGLSLGEMLEERFQWDKFNRADCKDCECPKFEFKQNMSFDEYFRLRLDK